MKSFGGLWGSIIAKETLVRAAAKAARGKRLRQPVSQFLGNRDEELEKLHLELSNESYNPAPFVQFLIYEPKPRRISCADFRDRVVHHALCLFIGSLLERSFIGDTFACRVGKGVHRAVLRAREMCQEHRFYAKIDICRFFDSIDHDVLLELLSQKFREKPLNRLFEKIVRHPLPGQLAGKGLPIGNLTSQWFANFYLDGADHAAKGPFKAKGYLRYMDDMVFFGNTWEELSETVIGIREWLVEKRHLSIKSERVLVGPVEDGLPFLGWRIFPGVLRLQPERLRRSRGRLKQRERQHRAGLIDERKMADSIRSIIASIRFLRPRFRFDKRSELSENTIRLVEERPGRTVSTGVVAGTTTTTTSGRPIGTTTTRRTATTTSASAS